jgi:hypothetical protein
LFFSPYPSTIIAASANFRAAVTENGKDDLSARFELRRATSDACDVRLPNIGACVRLSNSNEASVVTMVCHDGFVVDASTLKRAASSCVEPDLHDPERVIATHHLREMTQAIVTRQGRGRM